MLILRRRWLSLRRGWGEFEGVNGGIAILIGEAPRSIAQSMLTRCIAFRNKFMPFRSNIKYLSVSADLWLGDSLALLKTIPSGSVDLVVSSPPYCVGKEYDKHSTLEGFESEILRVTDELVRILKDGGNLCWQVGFYVSQGCVFPLDASIINLYRSQASLRLRNRIVWTFGHGVHASKRFSGRHETVLWYSKGDTLSFDVNPVRIPQRYPGKRFYKGPKKGELSGNPMGKNPGDVWEIPNVKAKHVEKTEHPCQFPVALASRLILALSPVGGIVLDPFMGSGTTGFASLLHQRNFMGSDISKNYLAISEDRLQKFVKGQAQYRKDVPIRKPNPNEAVSIRPEHFLLPV
jgi:adenine-specific DNA-methyltransferase